MLDLSPSAQLERFRARYTRLAKVGGFEPPAPDADLDALRIFWYEHKDQLEEADILDEIERMSPRRG